MKRIAFAALVALLAGCAGPPTEADRYRDECHNRGGFVTKESTSRWDTRYNCIGQTRAPQLPELKR